MQGIVVTKPLAGVNKKAIEEGLLVIQAQGKRHPFSAASDRGRKAH